MAYVDGFVAAVRDRKKTTANSTISAEAKTREDHYPIRQPLEFQGTHLRERGLHPLVLGALSGIAWFLGVMWLNYAGGPTVSLTMAIVTGIFVMFLTLFLATASIIVGPRRTSSTVCWA
jgi:hypothetical protein